MSTPETRSEDLPQVERHLPPPDPSTDASALPKLFTAYAVVSYQECIEAMAVLARCGEDHLYPRAVFTEVHREQSAALRRWRAQWTSEEDLDALYAHGPDLLIQRCREHLAACGDWGQQIITGIKEKAGQSHDG